jgi:hypothetical protein
VKFKFPCKIFTWAFYSPHTYKAVEVSPWGYTTEVFFSCIKCKKKKIREYNGRGWKVADFNKELR